MQDRINWFPQWRREKTKKQKKSTCKGQKLENHCRRYVCVVCERKEETGVLQCVCVCVSVCVRGRDREQQWMCKHTACVFVWTENRLSTCLSACEMWNRGGMCLCVYERAGVCIHTVFSGRATATACVCENLCVLQFRLNWPKSAIQ